MKSQKALAEQLKKSLKGVIVPDGNDHTAEAGSTGGGASGVLGDEEYRKAAMGYEENANREPKLGKPHQVGWDIKSVDRENNEVRFIEVKGKGCPWKGDEVVELSRAQVRASFSAKRVRDSGVPVWYLYVVEKTPEGDFNVLPIRNPAHTATRWILRGKAWRMVAEGALQRNDGTSHRTRSEE